jgi:hypothetical protein
LVILKKIAKVDSQAHSPHVENLGKVGVVDGGKCDIVHVKELVT